ncbi:MAG: hypothetical protein IKZ82_07770 [Clostridia bacterium]|nr:hypothetical protein [Clostridia bacterium]
MSKSREKLLIFSIIALVIATMLFIAYSHFNRTRSSNNAPVIFCASDSIYVSVDATDEDLLTGVTAMDLEDGDLTSSVVIGSISPFSGKGKCEVTYAVFDSGKRVATAKREICYIDYHPPRFKLNDDFLYYSGEAVNPLKNIRAIDCIDGEITNRISMAWLDTENEERIVEFRVINSHGDLSVLTTEVSVIERNSQQSPTISLTDYIVYIDRGEMLDPLDYVKSIAVSKNVYTIGEYGRDKLHYDLNGFDSSTTGTYKITIFCNNGQAVGSAELLVVVED